MNVVKLKLDQNVMVHSFGNKIHKLKVFGLFGLHQGVIINAKSLTTKKNVMPLLPVSLLIVMNV